SRHIVCVQERPMLRRWLLVYLCLVGTIAACGPTLPPTTAPPQPDPTFEPLRQSLQAYIDQTQPFRKQAAQAQENTAGNASPTAAATQALRTRQNALADALQTRLRSKAQQGEIFTPALAAALRHQIEAVFTGGKRDLILDDMAEQLDTPAT